MSKQLMEIVLPRLARPLYQHLEQFQLGQIDELQFTKKFEKELQKQHHWLAKRGIEIVKAAVALHAAVIVLSLPGLRSEAKEANVPLEVLEFRAIREAAADVATNYGMNRNRATHAISRLVAQMAIDSRSFCAEQAPRPNTYNSFMNVDWKRWLWRGVKLALGVVVLVFVGIQFQRDLAGLDLRQIELRPAWVVASAGLYLLGQLPSAWFWRHLHERFGYPLSHFAAIRAHLIGQLGKYVPGKALAVLIRSHLVHPCGVPYGVSVIASFYEVFTGMASGAILAAAIFALDPPTASSELLRDLGIDWHPIWFGLVLVALCGVPLLPCVFNFVIARLTAKIQAIELYRLPPVRFPTLAIGLVATGVGWGLQGLSVWAMLQAVMPEPPALSLSWWAQCTAGIAFATVAGFAIFVVPAGLGVRETLMKMLLSPAGPDLYIAMAVLLLRLDWIIAEALFALCTFWLKPRGERSEPLGSDPPK